jgi:diamine N-acetyltransferase
MIEGKRVSLRPIEEEDFALILRWQNHPEVWWYMDYERPFSLPDVVEDVERSRREGHAFVITVGGRPVGRIGLNQFRRRDRICSMYLFIGEPAFWGQGFARDAVMALLSFTFDRLDLHQVELWTLDANNRVMGMYERCGFVREAQLRERSWKDGRWLDRVWMSVNRDEFAKAREEWDSQAL